MRGIYWPLVDSHHKGPVVQETFLCHDMSSSNNNRWHCCNTSNQTINSFITRINRAPNIINYSICYPTQKLNTLRPRQNGRLFADDIFKRIFLNENVGISIKISLKFVHKGQINNIPALVQIMAWCRPGDKPLSEPMVVRLPTHICVTRPQWVKCMLPFVFHIGYNRRSL